MFEKESDFYNILSCPRCKGNLSVSPSKKTLICNTCKEVYQIKDGIPILF